MSFTRNLQSVCRGYILPLLLLVSTGGAEALGQTIINDNIINNYTSVETLYTYVSSDRDSVVVSDASAFSKDDIVMLYQPKGFLVDTIIFNPVLSPLFATADIGEYAFLVIEKIEGNTIIFNNSTDFGATKDYTVSQLIKVAVYDSAVVNSTITAPAWDSATGTGGVVAMYVKGRLQLGADIDVSGKGFKGAVPNPTDTYSGGCFGDDIRFRKRYYPINAYDTAGLKGEGAVVWNTLYARGKGRVMNGGGGGNASYAGGGGGGNFFSGGDGYGQSSLCSDPNGDEAAGEGGYDLQGAGLYANTGNRANRIFFGGGGGTGVYDAVGRKSSPGGDGGGIVVIVADEIYSNSLGGIYADGRSVTQVSEGAGGGGGAGGCIVLDANRYSGQIKLSATGGFGGSTVNGAPVTGPGGGGAGGVYWLKYYDNTIVDTIDNSPTNYGSTDTYKAQPGGETKLITNLEVPLRGFLFNTLPPNDTVCSDVIPGPIRASSPKGGVKPYSYRWIQSPNGEDGWVDAAGANDQMDYSFTAPLTDTTYYRRIVYDAGVLVDTSTIFTYVVVPEVLGNVIVAPDEICYGLTAEMLEQHPDSTLRGADLGPARFDTAFSWISRPASGGTWSDVPGSFSDTYIPSNLTASTLYSRIVYSSACADTSNAVQITVLPAITDNTIATVDKDTICFGMQSDPIAGTLPQQGAGPGSYTYVWQVSSDGVNWGTDPDSLVTSSNENFNLTVWDATKHIRRIVYSGEDSTCVSISNTEVIRVLDTISNNLLIPDNEMITICQFNPLPDGGIDATVPQGGDPGNYRYAWQVRDKAGTWADSSGVAPGTKFNLLSFDDTTYIRRMVVSGEDDVCRSYTDSLVVGIVWKIENNVLTAAPETYCQGDALQTTLTAGALSGGANGIGIQWQYRTETGGWIPAPGSNAQENYDFPEILGESLYFRRYAWSEPTDSVCFDTTLAVKITVQDSIRQNDILLLNDVPLASAFLDSVCAGLDLELTGTDEALTGGDESTYSFTWEVSSQPDFSASATAATPGYTIPDFRNATFFRRIVVSGVCEDTTEHLQIRPIELPTGKLVLAPGQADQVCSSEDIPVELEIEGLQLDPLAKQYSIYVSYASQNSSGSQQFERDVDEEPLADFFVATDSAETYVYTLDQIIDDRGCISESVDPNQPSILVFYSPEVTITAADTLVCGPQVRLIATNQGGVPPPKWFASTVKSNMDGSDTVTFTTDGLLEADAQLDFWFNDTVKMVYGFLLETSAEVGKACADSAYVTVTHFREPRQDTLMLAADDFYFRQTYDLTQLEPDIDVGLATWSVDNSGAGFADATNTIASGFTYEQEHRYTWTVENGRYPDGSYVCPVNTDEVVLVQHDLRQYEGFSPNNDGFNQVFVIPGLIHATDFTFTLYNSWGTRVYGITKGEAETREVEIDGELVEEHVIWDGYLEGQGTVASPGTYYYTLTFEIEGSAVEYAPKQGYIILRR